MNGPIAKCHTPPAKGNANSDLEYVALAQSIKLAIEATEKNAGGDRQKHLETALKIFSNPLLLLLVGAAITSFLVPIFQERSEYRNNKFSLMAKSHQEFLQFQNSVWEEYYSVFPLLHETEIDKATYIDYTTKQTNIKLARYQHYSTLLSLAVSFRDHGGVDTDSNEASRSSVEKQIEDYAILINRISSDISAYVGALYCGEADCWSSRYTSVVPADRLDAFDEITADMQITVSRGERVAERMIWAMQRE